MDPKIDDLSEAALRTLSHDPALTRAEALSHYRHRPAVRARLLAARVDPQLPATLAFIFGGVLHAVIDWKVQRLPTPLVYYTLAAVAAGLAFASLVEWDWKPLASAIVGAALFLVRVLRDLVLVAEASAWWCSASATSGSR